MDSRDPKKLVAEAEKNARKTLPPGRTDLAKRRESGRQIRIALPMAIAHHLSGIEENDGWVSAAKLRDTFGVDLANFGRATHELLQAGTIEGRGWGGGREYRRVR